MKDGLKVSKLKMMQAGDASMIEIYSLLIEMNHEVLMEVALSVGITCEGDTWKLVDELKEYGTTEEEVLRIIRSAGEEGLTGLSLRKTR